jgi:hypothetical protein
VRSIFFCLCGDVIDIFLCLVGSRGGFGELEGGFGERELGDFGKWELEGFW